MGVKSDRLLEELNELKAAALKVFRVGRDDDDSRTGDPRHCHTKPGRWDRDGSVCESCAAWNRMGRLARGER